MCVRKISFVLSVFLSSLMLSPSNGLAAWTSGVIGSSGFMSGTSGSDSISISISGHYLAHNRFTSGDPGFASDLDFDNSAAGEQKLVDDGSASLLVNGLGGSDNLSVRDGYEINFNNIPKITGAYIYYGSESGANRPLIAYLNFEYVNFSPQNQGASKIIVSDLDPGVFLTFFARDDQRYTFTDDFYSGNLDGIGGTVQIYSGGILEAYDPGNSNNNTLTIDQSGTVIRNGKTLLYRFGGSSIRWWSGTGHNQYYIQGNQIPEFQINGHGGTEDFILGSTKSELDGFTQPIQINAYGSGNDSLIVNDFGGGKSHSYVVYGSGTFSRDLYQVVRSSYLASAQFHFGPQNDVVTMADPSGFYPILLDAGGGGAGDILEILNPYPGPSFPLPLRLNILGDKSMINGKDLADITFTGFDYLFANGGTTGDQTYVTPSKTCEIILDADAPTTGLLDALTVNPQGHPYTLTGDTFQVQGYKPVSFYNYESIMTQFLDDDTSIPTGWSQFGSTTAKATTAVDTTNTALLATITGDPSSNYRIIGWLSDAANTMYYSSVGSGNFLRAKFYIYAAGQSGYAANEIPNFRLRIANRFAVTSMLTVSNHDNSDPEATALGYDLLPSNQYQPSVYRVDFDPVDVPQLVNNAATEGFLRAFETFEHDPQANGSIGMSECTVAVYPRLTDTNTTVPVTQNGLIKSYRPTPIDGGDFGTGNIGSSNSSAVVAKYFNGALETTGSQPGFAVGSGGVTLQTLNVESNRLGVAAFDVFNDKYDQMHHMTRARIEPDKQYRIRFHVTSTAAANLQPLLRFRARTIKFMYTASLEIGGATGASSQSNAIAAQALPGIGNQIPAFDRISPTENGGWYNVMMVSPMNQDIRYLQNNLAAQDDPGEDTQPGNNSKSRRDLQFGFDIIDTVSNQPSSGLERGQFTVDRVDIEKYDLRPN